jgi:hypothetical protein
MNKEDFIKQSLKIYEKELERYEQRSFKLANENGLLKFQNSILKEDLKNNSANLQRKIRKQARVIKRFEDKRDRSNDLHPEPPLDITSEVKMDLANEF